MSLGRSGLPGHTFPSGGGQAETAEIRDFVETRKGRPPATAGGSDKAAD